MVRKRIAKPAIPPPVAPTPNQDAHVEALATFLGTGSPLCEPAQSSRPPATLQIFGYQDLPQGGYNVRSKEERGGSRNLVYGFQNSQQDMNTFLRELEEEEERLWRRTDSKKAFVLVSKPGQAEGFEGHPDRFRETQVLNDLKGGIGALTGHISNDERSKLDANLQSITEQMKATPLNAKVLLNHPDGSPNENAFEEEAAVQKMLQDIRDLQTNVRHWANMVIKAKELANDAQEPAKEAKEPVREERDEAEWDTKDAITKTEPLIIRSGQSYESISMPPIDTQGPKLTANNHHISPLTRDATTDTMSAPEAVVKTEPVVKTEREQPSIQDFGTTRGQNMIAADLAPLPTAKPVMYSDVSHSEKNIDLWVAFWNGDKNAWDPLHEYLIGFSKSTRDDMWEEQMKWLREGICDPALSDVWVPKPLGGTARSTARQIDKFDLSLKKKQLDKQNMPTVIDAAQLFKKLDALQKPSQLWGNVDIPRQKAVHNSPAQNLNVRPAIPDTQGPLGFGGDFLDPTRQKRLLAQYKAEVALNGAHENHQRELAELLLKREQNLKNREVELEKHQKQRQEIEGLLKQREEHLNKRENQRQEVDGLLQKLEEKLQEREHQLAEREHRVHNREVEWEKQRQEIERLLQQREEQLQKRVDQLQTREDQSQKREGQLLSRETLLLRREGNAESVKLNEAQLAALQKTVEEAMEVRSLKINLSKRIRAIEGREMEASFAEEWIDALRKILEKRRDAEHVEVNVELGASGSPITKANWLAMLGIVEMSIKHDKVSWLNRHPQFWDFRQAVDYIQKDADEASFEGRGVKGPQYRKSAIDVRKDKEEIVAAFEQKAVASRQWKESGAVDSKGDDKPTPWSMLEAEKLPGSIPVKGCSGKWGCVCTSCHERDNLRNVHMQSSNKNGAAKVSASPCAGGWECTGGKCHCEAEKPAASSSTKNSTSNSPYDGHEKPPSLDDIDDGW